MPCESAKNLPLQKIGCGAAEKGKDQCAFHSLDTYLARPRQVTALTKNSVFLIGSGKVAAHLAQALQQTDYKISGIYSRHITHAADLAEKYRVPFYTDDLSLVTEAGVYVFCVTDSALVECVDAVAKLPVAKAGLFVHTSGSMGLDTLSPHKGRNAVMYPLQTFSPGRNIDFAHVPLFVEAADDATLNDVVQLAEQLSTKVTPLSSEKRRMLHLAAVFANNFSNHCFAIASEILRETGVSTDSLLPLIEETVEKLHQMPPAQAQTGPAVRSDANVMDKHSSLLAEHPLWQEVYRSMSASIADTAAKLSERFR